MATIIDNRGEAQPRDSGTGVIVGILIVIFLAILFLIFGLPYLRNRGTAPTTNSGGASINVNLPNGGDTGGTGGASGGAGASQ